MFSRVNYAIENIMYIFYCGTKGQTDVKQNYSSNVHDNAQYKTNIHFVSQNYLANVRVTRGTNSDMVENSLTGLNSSYVQLR